MIINARTNQTYFEFNWQRGQQPQYQNPPVEQVNRQSVGVSVAQLDAALAVVKPYLQGSF